MLEAYCACGDFETMANMVEELICHLAEKIPAAAFRLTTRTLKAMFFTQSTSAVPGNAPTTRT